MDDGGCLGAIIGGAAVIGGICYLIYLFVVYVVPYILGAAAIILGIFAVAGVLFGLGKAIMNFSSAVSKVSSRRKTMGNFKDEFAAQKTIDDGKMNGDYSLQNYLNDYFGKWGHDFRKDPEYKLIPENFCYEDVASKSYFFGPCFKDIFSIVGGAFSRNYETVPDFGRGNNWFTKVLFFVASLFQLLATHVLGTIFTLLLSVILIVLFFIFEIFFYVLAGITLLFEKIFYLSRKISYRCPSCKEDYLIPIYACSNPACNMKHRRLRPGFYGVFKRKCVCGTKIPLTAKSSGYYWEKDISTPNTFIKHKFKFSDMNSYCPKCGVEHNAGLSKPTSIALIGGKSAGKTTFKVAFTYRFLEEELTKMGIDFDFPDKQSDAEYENSKRYFRGQDIIPGTNRGIDYDIATFSFLLKHKKFDAARMIHVYDMPGEVFESGDAQEGWRNYRFSEGIVFLIDPYSLPMVRDLHTDEIKAMGVCEMQMNVLVDSLVNTLQNEKVKKSKGKFKIPVALTLNKVDSPILKKMCGGEAVEALMSNLPDIFDDYFTTIDYVCRCFISRNGGMGFIANLDNNFETVHFFFSSPMGYIPQYSRTGFKPINVLPVMQWMMLKADKQLARVWKPEMPVLDVSEEQKQLYQTHPEYYEQFVVPLLDTVVQQQV